jgi:hypothetical protein
MSCFASRTVKVIRFSAEICITYSPFYAFNNPYSAPLIAADNSSPFYGAVPPHVLYLESCILIVPCARRKTFPFLVGIGVGIAGSYAVYQLELFNGSFGDRFMQDFCGENENIFISLLAKSIVEKGSALMNQFSP